MKRFLSSLTAIVLCISLLAPLPAAAAASPAFTDINGHWAEGTIEQFADAGIITGFPDGSFRPDQLVTRAELAAIITRAFDLTEEVSFEFADVSPDAWFYEYLKFAARFIPNHQYGNNFAGNNPAFRSDVAATVAWIYAYINDLEIYMPPFEEMVEQVRSRFRDSDFRYGDTNYANVRRLFDAVWLANHFGLMHGCPEGYFRPAWGIRRAEMLTIIERMLDRDREAARERFDAETIALARQHTMLDADCIEAIRELEEQVAASIYPGAGMGIPARQGAGEFVWPSDSSTRVTSAFGPRRSPGGVGSTNHRGIDIGARLGTNVLAAASGTVVRSGWSGVFGNVIQINHGNGYHTLYAHNSVNLVLVGDNVVQGQIIGLVGSTGNATYPHIHFEIIRNGVHIDPMIYFM